MEGRHQYNSERENYETWKNKLANIIIDEKYIHPDDLPDYNYRERYDLGHSYYQTAKDYLSQISNEEAYLYWLKFIKSEFNKRKNMKIIDETQFENMYKKKLTCYKVVEGLLN